MALEKTIPHQDDVEAVIDARIATSVLTDKNLDDATYAVQGDTSVASPTAEVGSLKAAVDEVIAALVASGVIVAAE